MASHGLSIDNIVRDVDKQRGDKRRDIRRYGEALIAAQVGPKEGGKAKYTRAFFSYAERDWRQILQVQFLNT